MHHVTKARVCLHIIHSNPRWICTDRKIDQLGNSDNIYVCFVHRHSPCMVLLQLG